MSQPDDSGATHPTPETFNPVTCERDTYQAVPASRSPGQPWVPDDGGWTHDERRQRPGPRNQRIWQDGSWPPRKPAKRRRQRWAVSALAFLAAVAIAAGLVVYLGGAPGKPARASATASSAALAKKTTRPEATPAALVPPISPAAARDVLAGYTARINAADAKFSAAALGGADSQGSYALVAGDYRQQVAERAKPAAAPASRSARFYIPLEAAAYPHWFAVRVVNATTGTKSAIAGTQYLVFLQPAAGASWKEVDQPYALGTSPDIALSAAGYATAVSPGASGLTVTPSQIAGVTARSLDGHGAIPAPGNLQDVSTAAAWRRTLPRGATVSLTHAAAGYPVFGLRTAGGGALLFYTDSARLVARPAKHGTLKLSVPGYYTGKQRLSSADLTFLDQFAAYDPPATIPGLSIIADDSGIVR